MTSSDTTNFELMILKFFQILKPGNDVILEGFILLLSVNLVYYHSTPIYGVKGQPLQNLFILLVNPVYSLSTTFNRGAGKSIKKLTFILLVNLV